MRRTSASTRLLAAKLPAPSTNACAVSAQSEAGAHDATMPLGPRRQVRGARREETRLLRLATPHNCRAGLRFSRVTQDIPFAGG